MFSDGIKTSARSMESLEKRTLFAAFTPGFGLYNPQTSSLTLDYNHNDATNVSHTLGTPGSQAVAADFNGDTVTDTAAFLNGVWSIDYNNDGSINKTVNFGSAGDLAVAGDITGTGKASLGVYDPSSGLWSFSENQDGVTNFTYQDQPGGVPLLADFNHTGHADLILYRNGLWTVTDPATKTVIKTFTLGGQAGDVPIIADYLGNNRPDPGIFNNGTWLFDTTRTGQFNYATGYINGSAGEQPLVGYFNASNAIFVAPGGSGNGSLGNPVGTIQAGLNLAHSGQSVRIAAGNYPENLYLHGTDNVDIIGAGMKAVSIDPSSGDALALDRNTNTWVYNLDFAAGQNGAGQISASKPDRGLVMLGGSVFVRGISTVGTVDEGVITTGYLGVNVSVNARDCHFDGLYNGDGARMGNDTTFFARGCTFDGNGTNPGLSSSDEQSGRGLIVENSCTADVKNCDMSNNHAVGIISASATVAHIRYCTISNNHTGDGMYTSDQATIVFRHNFVDNNGQYRSVALGNYGLEIGNGFTGPTVIIAHNTFNDAGAAGVYVGNGSASITNNSFYNDMLGVAVNGALDTSVSNVPIHTTATITGNTFSLPAGSSGEGGIYGIGSDATGTIGGDGMLANTFINFPDKGAIAMASFGFNPRRTVGDPSIAILANNYINSPDPINIY